MPGRRRPGLCILRVPVRARGPSTPDHFSQPRPPTTNWRQDIRGRKMISSPAVECRDVREASMRSCLRVRANTAQRAHPDLNQGPADLQSAALTTELYTR